MNNLREKIVEISALNNVHLSTILDQIIALTEVDKFSECEKVSQEYQRRMRQDYVLKTELLSGEELEKIMEEFDNNFDDPDASPKEYRQRLAQALIDKCGVKEENHCKDCCCAKSWEALGIKKYDGLSIPEHISALKAELFGLKGGFAPTFSGGEYPCCNTSHKENKPCPIHEQKEEYKLDKDGNPNILNLLLSYRVLIL